LRKTIENNTSLHGTFDVSRILNNPVYVLSFPVSQGSQHKNNGNKNVSIQ
jgi:hypothetical protein